MIEYALLFGLGFLSAALIAMLVAPAIHRRIVHFTENRLKATMPLSPQEIRAQKDMVRAAYAAENAKTTHALTKERERAVSLQLQNETLAQEARRLLGENQELATAIEDMEVAAGELRSRLRRDDNQMLTLQEALRRTEEALAAKDLELEAQLKRLNRLSAEVDNLTIEATSRETEIDNLKQRMQILRDEREELRRENKLLVQRAKGAEQRLAQEEHTRIRLDDRLVREMAENADREALIERRQGEIARLKDKLKQVTAASRAAARALRAAKLPVPELVSEAVEEEEARTASGKVDAEQLAEEVRHRQTALTERLRKAKSSANDEALREEIADLAARMIVLTAVSEGPKSPVRELLSKGSFKGAGKRITLAERARKLEPGLFE